MGSTRQADLEVAIAEAFGRPAPPWAVDELGTDSTGSPAAGHLLEEARVNVATAQLFGRDPSPTDLALVEQADAQDRRPRQTGRRAVTETAPAPGTFGAAVFERGTRGVRRRIR